MKKSCPKSNDRKEILLLLEAFPIGKRQNVMCPGGQP